MLTAVSIHSFVSQVLSMLTEFQYILNWDELFKRNLEGSETIELDPTEEDCFLPGSTLPKVAFSFCMAYVLSPLQSINFQARQGRNCVMATYSQEYLSVGSSLMQGLGMNYLTIFPEAAQCTDKSMRCQGEGGREEREYRELKNLPCMRPCSWPCFNPWYHIWSPEHCQGHSWAQN